MPTRLILSWTCLMLVILVLLPTPSRVDACCMIPEDYAGRVGQAEQTALLIHRDGVEDLILGITYRITPGADGKLPEKLTWLIALPSEPVENDGYGLADEDLFDELGSLAYEKLVRQLPRPRVKHQGFEDAGEVTAEALEEGVELGRAVQVGPYDIQPVRGVGQNALNGLNAYLKQRGFPVEDPDHMAWFVEHGFTFLCIEVTPGEDQKTLSAGEALPPLRVRFKTEHPYYPLRYSSQQGDFKLALYTLTAKPIDLRQSMSVLKALGWENVPGRKLHRYAQWKKPQRVATKELLGKRMALGSLPDATQAVVNGADEWSFGLFEGRPNPKDRPISSWTGDCFFTLKDQAISPLATRIAKAGARP